MKTRDFASNAEVATLVDAFEAATIALSQFKHAAHMAVALSYLANLPLADALAQPYMNKTRLRLSKFIATSYYYYENTNSGYYHIIPDALRRCFERKLGLGP